VQEGFEKQFILPKSCSSFNIDDYICRTDSVYMVKHVLNNVANVNKELYIINLVQLDYIEFKVPLSHE